MSQRRGFRRLFAAGRAGAEQHGRYRGNGDAARRAYPRRIAIKHQRCSHAACHILTQAKSGAEIWKRKARADISTNSFARQMATSSWRNVDGVVAASRRRNALNVWWLVFAFCVSCARCFFSLFAAPRMVRYLLVAGVGDRRGVTGRDGGGGVAWRMTGMYKTTNSTYNVTEPLSSGEDVMQICDPLLAFLSWMGNINRCIT
jgi:hypothetical protein